MQVKRLTVGKGKTTKPDSNTDELTKEYYEIEAAIEDAAELEITKANLAGLLEGWLSPTSRNPNKPIQQFPKIDGDKFAKLPWKTYKTKQDCKPDEPGWIFTNTQGAEALADLIEKQGNGVTIQLGQYNYDLRFSGSDKQFIGRSPVKN
jgi:hypothetical protein